MTKDMKVDLPFKLKSDREVSQKQPDLQNRIINLINQCSLPASVGTR